MRNLNLNGNIIIELMMREDGATIHDFSKVGYRGSAMAAVKMAKRRNLKTKIVRGKGVLNRYYAFKPTFKGR